MTAPSKRQFEAMLGLPMNYDVDVVRDPRFGTNFAKLQIHKGRDLVYESPLTDVSKEIRPRNMSTIDFLKMNAFHDPKLDEVLERLPRPGRPIKRTRSDPGIEEAIGRMEGTVDEMVGPQKYEILSADGEKLDTATTEKQAIEKIEDMGLVPGDVVTVATMKKTSIDEDEVNPFVVDWATIAMSEALKLERIGLGKEGISVDQIIEEGITSKTIPEKVGKVLRNLRVKKFNPKVGNRSITELRTIGQYADRHNIF
jgi:translation initiation factor IF-1